MTNQIKISIEDNLYTDFSGIKRLFDFYHSANLHKNTNIYIDFSNLNWLDANLSALLGSMLYKLSHNNNLTFSTDLYYVYNKFDVLFRNGFLDLDKTIIDEKKSTISFRSFNSSDKTNFIDYVKNDLLSHRSMPFFSGEDQDKIIHALIEIFCNIQTHANTCDPFFVCGQYYATKKQLIFTMVDLGVGFLPAIQKKTGGEISDSSNAILWALKKKNTTKSNNIGGLGLYDLDKYFNETNGNLQIITGDCFWGIELKDTIFNHRIFQKPYIGSVINLFFSCN